MMYTSEGFRVFMTRGFQGADHVWLVMMKAMRALTRYAAAGIEETGLGLSDFGVLEILLHKGPLPVNTIGPIVDLTPGSISIAVDRLVAKGLVSRVESAEDSCQIDRSQQRLPFPSSFWETIISACNRSWRSSSCKTEVS